MLKNKVIYLLLFLLFINNHEYLFSQQMDQSEVLKDQKFSVSVDFPETINFHFEGESSKKIDDIKVEFKTGDRKTLQYAYMDFAQKDSNVIGDMEFRINTQGGVIPPGSKITWNLVIYFDDNTKIITPDQNFVLMDTRFDDWELYEDGSINIYYRYSRTRAERLSKECNELLQEMFPIVGNVIDDPITIVLYNNYSEMIGAISSKSKTSDRELITAGQAFDEASVVLVLAGRNDIGTSTHEIMHILVGRATDGSILLPLWLNEGLAEYANRDKTVTYDHYLDWGIGTDNLKPLKQLIVFPGDPNLTLVSYGQSRSVVKYLIDSFGKQKMELLLSNLSDGQIIDDALLTTYGFSLDGLDNNWREYVGANPYYNKEGTIIDYNKELSDSTDKGSCNSNGIIYILASLSLIYFRGLVNIYSS